MKTKLKPDKDLAQPFSETELSIAIQLWKKNNAPDLDEIFPKFIIYLGKSGNRWLQNFFNDILEKGQMPKGLKELRWWLY